jgi:ribosomal protein S25
MRQMAKAQSVQKGKGKSKSKSSRTGGSSGTEKKTLRIVLPNPRDKDVERELQKMKVLTPYIVASRFNLRLGVAKDFLEEMHRQGTITFVSSGRNIKIYKPAG